MWESFSYFFRTLFWASDSQDDKPTCLLAPASSFDRGYLNLLADSGRDTRRGDWRRGWRPSSGTVESEGAGPGGTYFSFFFVDERGADCALEVVARTARVGKETEGQPEQRGGM